MRNFWCLKAKLWSRRISADFHKNGEDVCTGSLVFTAFGCRRKQVLYTNGGGTCPSSSKRKYPVSLIDVHTAHEIYRRNTSPLTKRELIQIEIAFVRF